ncbi:MAG: S46 family peptidase, partial [Bacteroidota bacterium]|nr:S46 family peptidase [Bacteroidota bacterium]
LTQYAERLLKAFKENGNQGYTQIASRIISQLDPFYTNYRPEVDREVFVAVTEYLKTKLSTQYYPTILATVGPNLLKNIYDESIWASKEKLIEHINQGGNAFTTYLEKDAAFQIYMELKKVMDEKLSPSYNTLNDKIQVLQKDYVTALKVTYPDHRFWPDANNTMRVSYGQVEPYNPRDGVTYKTQTYLEGVMEKYIPGDYEFDVHPKLIELYNSKNYGQYAEGGKLPVCFIASNHTTGGNSGSPAIDAYGNLIGINFDRVWEGTMSDLYYDKSICRNIMVDIRYILFVVDKFAGATHLVNEMKLVHPKA